MTLLELKDVHTYYGNIHALKGISIRVNRGEIITLIGSNGAGKTTTLSTIMGHTRARYGKITLMGQDITSKPTVNIVKMGVGVSPEGREVFPSLTVEENLRIGAYTLRDKAEISSNYKMVYELFPRLAVRKNQAAGTMSGGEQQMLAIGRALMNSPKLILLDEPSLGLAPNLVSIFFNLICRINKSGVTILLVEQNAHMALTIADRGYVMETGRIILSDNAESLVENDMVREAYLGAVE